MSSPYYPQGRYVCRVLAQGLSESKDKATPFIWVRVKVLKFDDGQAVDISYDRTVSEYITTGTIPYLTKKLKSLGFSDKISMLSPDHEKHHSLIGVEGIFICSHDNNYEKWQMAWEDDGFITDMKPLDSRKLRELDQLFGKQTHVTATPPAAKRSATVPADGITDADVPF